MSKLFKLKKWLTVLEAAKHLSILFGEEVAESDVLHFGLDGHLKLSVNFVNQAYAQSFKAIPIGNTQRITLTKLSNHILRLPGHLRQGKEQKVGGMGLQLNSQELLETDHTFPKPVVGIYDLPMLGSEQLAVEHYYQKLIGGALTTDFSIVGAFVQDSDGNILQVLQRSGDLPALELPSDAELVVRTEALRELEISINANLFCSETPLAMTERNTLLKQIGTLSLALAEQSKKYKRGEKPNGLQIATVTGEIVDALPGANVAGTGASSIRESIRQGIELLTSIQQ